MAVLNERRDAGRVVPNVTPICIARTRVSATRPVPLGRRTDHLRAPGSRVGAREELRERLTAAGGDEAQPELTEAAAFGRGEGPEARGGLAKGVDGVQHAEAVEDGMTLSLQGSCHPIVERHRFRSTAERHDP